MQRLRPLIYSENPQATVLAWAYGSFPPSTSGDNNAQRRSQRVMVKVSVMVLGEGVEKKSVSEETDSYGKRARRNDPPRLKGLDRTIAYASQ
jgi:hypothetical protein